MAISDEDIQHLDTIGDMVRWGASRFAEAGLHFGHGTDNAVDESLQLVLHALHLEPPLPAEFHRARLTPAERVAVAGLFRRRIGERRPAAYLTGRAWFAGMDFEVDERVLVPRSPLAEVIECGFSPWTDPDAISRVLDLCTGSGCIAIACAAHMPWTEVVATDLSEDALEVAARNVARHHLADRVSLVRSDVYDGLPEGGFDLVVGNPPYVARDDFDALPAEFRHEPALGLVAGSDGLEVIRRILEGAAARLRPGGLLVVEAGSAEDAVAAAWPQLPFTWLEFERGGAGVFLLRREDLPGG